METNCDCKTNLKEGERKEDLAEQQGRNEEEFSVCSHFPLSWQYDAASVTEPGQAAGSLQTKGQNLGVMPRISSSVGGSDSVLSAFTFHGSIERWSVLGFLLLSAFPVVFLPNHARQRTQKRV